VVRLGADLCITWVKAASVAGTYGVDFLVETSESLTGAWTMEPLGPNVSLTGNQLKFTFPPSAAGGKKFARLKILSP
jgi:hypothetical protein